jgi:hypothetical protein
MRNAYILKFRKKNKLHAKPKYPGLYPIWGIVIIQQNVERLWTGRNVLIEVYQLKEKPGKRHLPLSVFFKLAYQVLIFSCHLF